MKENMEKPARWLCPKPEQCCWEEGAFKFGRMVNCRISAIQYEEKTVQTYKELWNKFTSGFGDCTVIPSGYLEPNHIILSSEGVMPDTEFFPELDDGMEYAVRVIPSMIYIKASHSRGLQYAWNTLMQMINPCNLEPGEPEFAIPCCNIQDKPSLAFRGIHVCVFPETSLNFLEKMVRIAGLLKYSHIILEFWGMLQYNVMPELAWPHAFTKMQIRPIIDAARSLGMEVIPMFNHLGHASASRRKYGKHVVLDQNPAKALLFEPDGWTWCLSNPEVHTLLKAVREELMELCGQGEYFHLGCDESYSYATCDLCRKQDRSLMFTRYLNQIADELSSVGRRAIIWGDMLLYRNDFDDKCICSSVDLCANEMIANIDRRIIIADWQYDITEGHVPTAGYFIDQGFDTLLSPWNDMDNIKTLAKNARELNALGMLLTTWHVLNEPQFVLCAAEHAWVSNEEHAQKDEAMIWCKLAEWTRKFIPANGDYYAAGYRKHDIDV